MESIVDYKPWFIRAENKKNAPWIQVTLEAGKRHAKTVIAKLEHCDDRDLALTYVGNEIAIELKQLEALKRKNEYYWRDLLGLRVINQQGMELGTVKNLMETGANDVLVVVSDIKDENGEKVKAQERLIPWTMNNAIIGVDLERKVIEVDWDADF
jgi:16S rRNA processing protein RimM